MSLFGEVLGEQRARATMGLHPSNPNYWWDWGQESATGLKISEVDALGHPPVLQAICLIASMMSILPLHTLKSRSDGGRNRATDHRLWWMLRNQPNPEQTAQRFTFSQYFQKLLYGARYAEIEFDKGGRPLYLWPLPSRKVKPVRLYVRPGGKPTENPLDANPESRRRGGQLFYRVQTIDGPKVIEPGKIFHVPDITFDGNVGQSRLALALEPVAIGLAAQQKIAALFGNNARPDIVLQRPPEAPPLGPKGQKSLLAAWEAQHRGVHKSGRVGLVQEGTEVKEVGFTPEQAQLLETRQFSILDASQIFNIPPYFLGYPGSKNTYSNVEAEWIRLVRMTLMPHATGDEQEILAKMISEEEAGVVFAEYETKALLKADSKARGEFYKTVVGLGAMTPGEVARTENLPAVPPEQGGDTFRIAGNLVVANLGIDGEASGERSAPASVETRSVIQRRSIVARKRLRKTFLPLLLAAMERMVGRESGPIRKALERADSVEDFLEWLRSHYDSLGAIHESVVGPVLRTLQEAVAAEAAAEVDLDVEDILEVLESEQLRYSSYSSARWTGRHRGQLEALARDDVDDEWAGRITERLDSWDETEATRESRWEVVAAAGAVLGPVFLLGGYTRYRWNKSGDTCELCNQMHGRIVGIGGTFLGRGDRLDVDDPDTQNLEVTRDIFNPPLHGGCDCYLTAEP